MGYGLQPSNNGKTPRSGTYKAPEFLRKYIDSSQCTESGITTRYENGNSHVIRISYVYFLENVTYLILNMS